MVRKREVLRELYLFSSLTDQECIKVNRDLYQCEVASGETVLREGDLGAELYMVVRGRVDVRRRGVSLGDIGPGGHFGEFSLVSQAPRSATVSGPTSGLSLRVPSQNTTHPASRLDRAVGTAIHGTAPVSLPNPSRRLPTSAPLPSRSRNPPSEPPRSRGR